MKVCFKGMKEFFVDEKKKVVMDFFNFLNTQLPLDNDIIIRLIKNRDVKMTTGVRLPGGDIHILVKGRLLIDIMRTIAHEWVHEFQHQKMGLKDFDKIKDIGGPEENMANVLSGIFIKQFEKKFPNYSPMLYGEDSK